MWVLAACRSTVSEHIPRREVTNMNRADWRALGNLLDMATACVRYKASTPGTRASDRALRAIMRSGLKVYKARTTGPKRTRR